MKKIYQELPIEFWEDLACFVQDNKIENIGDFLGKNNVDNNSGKYKPTCTEEIGTISLIKAINEVESFCYNSSSSRMLFENIYALKNLGVKNIAFNPIGLDEFVGIGKTDQDFTKVYTDGKFRIKKVGTTKYGLDNIQDANYILNICIDTRKNLQVTHPSWNFFENPNYNKIVFSQLQIKNFKFLSSLPSQKELSLIQLPELSLVTPTFYDWDGRPFFKEKFETTSQFDTKVMNIYKEYNHQTRTYPKELIKSITTK